MSFGEQKKSDMSRRRFLAMTGGAVAAAGASGVSMSAPVPAEDVAATSGEQIVPFRGPHQAGIVTPAQTHTYLATFDIATTSRDDLINMLQQWTVAAERMSVGQTAEPIVDDVSVPANDSGETLELPPARLTLTFGFGPGLFIKNGTDRFGLAARRPAALIDLPRFNGDQLVDAQTGGDISVQACADDPQVAFHAVRQLARLAYGIVEVRWAQTGFLGKFAPGKSHRNLMGFKDGTGNPSVKDPALMNQFVWAGDETPWMTGGSYMVVRRARIALEHWDRMNVAFQEQAIGRQKYSGAGLGEKNEFDPVDLDANDKDGNPIVPDNAHVRLAMPASNDGARILRRSYSYNDGVSFTSERWPPWRQGMEYDAGLLFIGYQKDVRTGFVKIFEQMSRTDMLGQFVTHVGSGVFACPPGIGAGEFIGQSLFTKL